MKLSTCLILTLFVLLSTIGLIMVTNINVLANTPPLFSTGGSDSLELSKHASFYTSEIMGDVYVNGYLTNGVRVHLTGVGSNNATIDRNTSTSTSDGCRGHFIIHDLPCMRGNITFTYNNTTVMVPIHLPEHSELNINVHMAVP